MSDVIITVHEPLKAGTVTVVMISKTAGPSDVSHTHASVHAGQSYETQSALLFCFN